MKKIIVISDSSEDLIDRFKPLIEEIKKSDSDMSVVGIFYCKNCVPLLETNKELFEEIHFPLNLKELHSTLKKQKVGKILAFIKHRPAVKDVFIYLTLKLTRTNIIYLRKNLVSLKRYLMTDKDEDCIVFRLIMKATIKNIIVKTKLYLFFLIVLLLIHYRKMCDNLLPRKKKAEKHKILIMRLDKLGDMVISYPYIKALRDAYPDSLLTILTSSAGYAFVSEQQKFEQRSVYDKVITWDAPWHHKKRFKLQSTTDLLSVAKLSAKLWKEKYDLVIQPIVFGTGTALAALTLGKQTVAIIAEGFPLANMLKRYISDPVIAPHYFKDYHIEEPLKHVMMKAGVVINTVWRQTTIPEDSKNEMRLLLSEKMNIDNKSLVTVNVGTGKKVSRWNTQKFGSLCDQICKKKNVAVVLIGGNDDISLADDIERLSNSSVINFTGQLNLNQVAALIGISEIVVTCDTGIMHLAALVNANIVAMFGAGPVPYCRPLCDNYTIVKHEFGCSDCGDSCFTDGIAPCMEAIRVEEVLLAVDRLLAVIPISRFENKR